MYHLYIDESGYVQNYQPNTHSDPDHRYFVLGGIIVEDKEIENFEYAINQIVYAFFGEMELPKDFKLCYHGLRRCKKYPYNKLILPDKLKITQLVFDAIATMECNLISCQINLDYVYKTYLNRIPQRTLALSFLTERFQYFLLDRNDHGKIIHEYATAELNKEMQTNYGRLYQTHNLPKTVSFDRVDPKIKFARVKDEPILQFSDFFAYSVLIRAKTGGTKQARWESISHKYYNLNHVSTFKRGNCSM